jgi:hypothetical protein
VSDNPPEVVKRKIGCGCIVPFFLVFASFWILWTVNYFLIAISIQLIASSSQPEPSVILVGILAALATIGELLIILHPDVYHHFDPK